MKQFNESYSDKLEKGKEVRDYENLRELQNLVFPLVDRICQEELLPLLASRGIKIIKKGENLGEIVTNLDVDASRVFLYGDKDKVTDLGFYKLFPGSFTEEEDSNFRKSAEIVYENDPCDGTGDVVKTADSKDPLWPTNLTSKLVRDKKTDLFVPVAGMIRNVAKEYAILSNGSRIVLGIPDDKGKCREISCKKNKINDYSDKVVRINWRSNYPQHNAHDLFIDFLRENGWTIEQVKCGGAGDQALRLIRSCVEPNDKELGKEFNNLEPIDIIFNAQPDWKTWDTDPTTVAVKALKFPPPTDLYGNPLKANAANNTLKDMHHTEGVVFSNSEYLSLEFSRLASEFQKKYPDKKLTEKNY